MEISNMYTDAEHGVLDYICLSVLLLLQPLHLLEFLHIGSRTVFAGQNMITLEMTTLASIIADTRLNFISATAFNPEGSDNIIHGFRLLLHENID